MKPASTAFKNNLFSYYNFWIAELLTLTLLDGTIVRYTNFETDVTLSGTVYSSSKTGNPAFEYEGLEQKIGVEVDEARVELWATAVNLVEGTAILEAFGQGLFDAAAVTLQRVLMPNPNDGSIPRPINFDTTAGAVTLMQGTLSDITALDRTHVAFDVKSKKELLNRPFPAHVYQPSCRWDLYGAGCTLNKTSFQVSGTVAAGAVQQLFNTNLTNVDNYFDQGLITFTSGQNNGITRTVRLYLHASGQVLLFLPLPFAPANGDTFHIYPGCAKTMSVCQNTFANLINFGGFPFVPVAESAI